MNSDKVTYMEVDGHSVAYRQAGQGPPLVLLHGFLCDSRCWRHQLQMLSDQFTVIAWDAPGAGLSSDPPVPFTISDWSHCLATFLNRIGIDQAHILGLSWGGLLAQEFYRLHPACILRLILADTSPGWKGSFPESVCQQRLARCERDSLLPPQELLRSWAHVFEHGDWGTATVFQDTFVMVNPMFAKMHGYTVEELIGRSIYDVLAAESQTETREQLRIAYEAGHHVFENQHIRKDGSIFPALTDTSVIRDSQRNVLYCAINIQDITELKHAEEALKESRQYLQVLSRRLVEVQEEERRAIARELHDSVGQNLSALKLNLTMMESPLSQESPEHHATRLKDSLHLINETTQLLRDLLAELRPAVLHEYGLKAALQAYVDEFLARYNINLVLDIANDPFPRLNSSLQVTLLRIAQEAVTNIARYAQADQATLSLRLQNNTIHLTVLDNGIGIEASQGKTHHISHGLKIMRERAEAFGGKIKIETSLGKGTIVEAIIPLENTVQNIA